MWGKGRLMKLSLAVITGVMTLAVALISVYMMWEQAPTLPTRAAAAEQVVDGLLESQGRSVCSASRAARDYLVRERKSL